ncbi:MAG: MFS transporter [Candidatus Marinimicrobia bacterium]|nr:MFS transporter [Candidatus Neomarinimicrobiota bacterium]|tara:strand:- start:49693 stop:51042 length:1350 start_codon:yes stop_codon:yes gene_type:complete
MIERIKKFYSPAYHIDRLPDNMIDKTYKRYRWSTMESTFLGYAMFYLVRNNLSTVAKDVGTVLSYDHNMIGNILAISSIAYGLGKFFMGSLSDRANPRKFMATGLFLTGIVNFIFGSMEIYWVHLLLWTLNGFVQGMGWPPCGRSLGHWYSLKERGSMFAVWNISHNIGGGLAGVMAAYAASKYGWHAAFYFPGAIALLGSFYLFWRLRDTPQSVGLPPIEEYKADFIETEKIQENHEHELTTRELFIDNILRNKYLWIVAFANFFVYIIRYSMLDWGPMYLREIKGATLQDGGFAILLIEFAGIPSTLIMGWLSDRLSGRRGMVSLICIIPIFFAFTGIYLNPPGNLDFDMAMLVIVGLFIYPPVMLLGVAGIDLTSKKAVGTAAGFIGLFGYLGRSSQAKGFGWIVDHYGNLYGIETGWNYVIFCILGANIAGIILLSLTWKIRPKA